MEALPGFTYPSLGAQLTLAGGAFGMSRELHVAQKGVVDKLIAKQAANTAAAQNSYFNVSTLTPIQLAAVKKQIAASFHLEPIGSVPGLDDLPEPDPYDDSDPYEEDET